MENRKQRRVNLELRVDYVKMNTFFADYTKNLSKGGSFIQTPIPLPVGTLLTFLLHVPTLPEPIPLRAEVSWTLDAAAAEHAKTDPGMGVEFRFETDEERLAFEHTVEQLMVEHLGEGLAADIRKHA